MRLFMGSKLQTGTPTLHNLGRNKRLLYLLSDQLNRFHRNKTVHHADTVTYFNCFFLKTDE